MKLVLIGGGAIGEAMVRCLLAQGVVAASDVMVSDISPLRRQYLEQEYGVGVSAGSAGAVDGADLVILAVKPQSVASVLDDVRVWQPGQLVLSVVAGLDVSTLCSRLGHSVVVRAMPNMPAQVGRGMTVWTAASSVSEQQRGLARSTLCALGEELYVEDEAYLDMATALSGSGPGYVFLFIEALIDAGVHIGLPREMAQKLAVQTVRGSAEAVEGTKKHPAELRNMVTSPGGTTAEAILRLERGALRSLVLDAVIAAYHRAKNLRE